MVLLLSDPRVAAVPLVESGEPLVRLDGAFGPAHALVRRGLAERLSRAAADLPDGLSFLVVEGHRSMAGQRAIITEYDARVRAAHPAATTQERHHLVSRYVAPAEVAPHVAAAAVDLTLADDRGELDLGTPLDATPEESDGRCFTSAADLPADARALRDLMARVLGVAGLVNYPTEWWHWSHGDRYWALVTGAPAAIYGPLDPTTVAA